MTNDIDSAKAPEPIDFPEARVRDSKSWRSWLAQSTLPVWLITTACVGVAIYLGYQELSPPGEPIVIHFQDGHGVKAEDHVRYRGIVVGEVDRVELDDTLHGVSVHVHLNEHAASLAREGSHFWVERPEVSLGAIRGLDTLVGGRYVAVLPGQEGNAKQTEFAGLEQPPAHVDVTEGGLPITLISEDRFGLQRGAPVSYRGMTVGKVSSVSLSENGLKINVRAVVDEQYRDLVRDNTQFWNNGGIDMKFGLGGFDLDIDTLSSLAMGGIAFATPQPAGEPAPQEQTFELLAEEVEGWQKWQPAVGDQSAHGEAEVSPEKKTGFLKSFRSRFGGKTKEDKSPPDSDG